MHDKKMQPFAQRLFELAKHLQGINEQSVAPPFIPLVVGDQRICISGPHVDTWRKLLSDFYRCSGWSDKYSETHVEKILQKVLGELHSSNSIKDAQEKLKRHTETYKQYQTSHSVRIPLHGIELDPNVSQLTIGRVTITKCKRDELYNSTQPNLLTVISQISSDLPEECVCASFEAAAEPTRAKELALVATRESLDVVRYAIPFIYPEEYKSRSLNVGILGEFSQHARKVFVRSSDNNVLRLFAWERSEQSFTVPISSKTLESCGAAAVADLLKKPSSSLNEVEKLLIRGLHWFGNALCQREAENELLSLTTCLETFLNSGKDNGIKKAIAKRTATLLGATDAKKTSLEQQVQRLYGKRSEISHGEVTSVLESELVALRDIAKGVFKRVIELSSEVTTKDSLLQKIEDLESSGQATKEQS